MRAFPVSLPSGARYWTVLDEDLAVVPVADEFLRHVRFGRDGAESTTKSYANSIALFLRWCARSARTSAGTTRSSSRNSSSSTPHHRGRTARAARSRPRQARQPGPRPAPSSTSRRTANSPGTPASGILLISWWADEQLPATSTTPRENRRRTLPHDGSRNVMQHPVDPWRRPAGPVRLRRRAPGGRHGDGAVLLLAGLVPLSGGAAAAGQDPAQRARRG